MKMKMMVVLVLSGLLWVSAEVLHEDINISGCSDSDGEFMYGLDGEEVWYADFKNNKGVEPQPSFVDHMTVPGGFENALAQLQICRQNLQNAGKAFKDYKLEKDAPSSPVIYTKEYMELGQENVLICYVTGFYPAPVNISWTKNSEKITEGTSFNVPFVNKDGTFRQFSTLKFTPEQGDVYSCEVKHLALDQPLTRIWGDAEGLYVQMWRCDKCVCPDVEKPEPSIGPSVFCGLGLTVGLLGVAAGTFFLIKGNECS